MAKRREPGQKEYNPLDDSRGRLPIESDLIRAVTGPSTATTAPPPAQEERQQLTVINSSQPMGAPPAQSQVSEPKPETPRAELKTLTLEKLTAYNKFLTTQTEKLELDRLAAHISGALRVSVKSSQLIRACLVLMLRAENQIVRRAEDQPRFKRPSNAEPVALAEFDQLLAEILSLAFRDAGPLRPRV